MDSFKDIKEYVEKYRYAPKKVVTGVDRILKLKKTLPQWEVIAEIVNFWASLNPSQYDSYLVRLRDIKATRKKTTIGTKEFVGISKDKGTGGYINYMVDVPVKVMSMIRIVYNSNELQMDKKFFRKFGRKFPAFRVSHTKG
jgi:hypothetical protein